MHKAVAHRNNLRRIQTVQRWFRGWLARKLAGTGLEATKKLGGIAANMASSWLSRNGSVIGKTDN